MRILNAGELDRAGRQFPQAKTWLERWRVLTEAADWESLVDVRVAFPSADGIVLGRGKRRLVVTCFNVGGNDYRLLTRIGYESGLVQVERLLTHAEYNKDAWKKKYE